MSHPLRRRTLRLFAGAGILVVGALAWIAWPRTIVLETLVVDRGEVISTLVDLGETRVREPYAVNAPVAGQLRRILIEPGDVVAEGDVVAVIDGARSAPLDGRSRATLQASLAQAMATRQRARSELALASDDARRSASLWERRLIAEQVHRTAQMREAAARASLRETEAGIARIEAELGDGGAGGAAIEVRSPVAGTVLVRHAESARPVVAGEALLELGDLANLEIVAEFLSQDAALLRPGAQAWIEGWGGEPVSAQVRRISPGGRRKVSALGVEEQRVDIWIDPTVPIAGIGHGFQVEARIEVARAPSALRVPVESLVRIGDGWAVWRIVDQRLEQAAVKPGITDGKWREITDGLAEGDVIVRRPDATLHPDSRATPSRP